MSDLTLTQLFINAVVDKASGTLEACCQKLFTLQSWQQAPVGSVMLEYHGLVAAIVEVPR